MRIWPKLYQNTCMFSIACLALQLLMDNKPCLHIKNIFIKNKLHHLYVMHRLHIVSYTGNQRHLIQLKPGWVFAACIWNQKVVSILWNTYIVGMKMWWVQDTPKHWIHVSLWVFTIFTVICYERDSFHMLLSWISFDLLSNLWFNIFHCNL